MNNTFKKIALFGLIFVLFACDKNQVFDEYREFDGTWKKNQKADAACIRRNRTNKGSKSGI